MNIYILTLPNGFFGRSDQGWKSLDLDRVKVILEEAGNSVIIESITNANSLHLRSDDFVVYTSSDEEHIRAYIKDVMYILDKRCCIIPSYDCLMAHENKGFQALWRKYKAFGNLDGGYAFDKDLLPTAYPYVLKTIGGAGSQGVSLIHDDASKNSAIRKYFKKTIARRIILFLRWLKLNKSDFEQYSYRHKSFSLLAHQQFVPGLRCDYKVLIFSNKYYVLRRSTRKNDFRASGSGLFSFEEDVPAAILSFAKQTFDVLGAPFVSLDIAEGEHGCHLIEYQALHFGPYTLQKSPGYYAESAGTFNYIKGSSSLEDEVAASLNAYVSRRRVHV